MTTSASPRATRKLKIRGIPSWLPANLQKALRQAGVDESGQKRRKFSVSAAFSPGERRALRFSKPMPVSAWAEKFRVVENSSICGRWQNVFTPYLVGIMDATNLPGVETVIICKSPQTGGSESGHNLVGYCIDRLPGPVMYVFPDELTARENAQDRIIPMITSSPRLLSYMTGVGDDASSLRIKLQHMTISLAWSGSVSRLGNKPVRVLILDELDKYANPKNEARSEDLAEKRTTTWRSRRKIMKISTPTTENGPIWKAFSEEANARFRYWVRCPHCEEMQLMTFDNLTWPNKDGKDEPKSEDVLSRKLAWYACPHCGACWTDTDRDRAVRRGEWREEESGMGMYDYIAAYRPVKVAFHVPAFLSYFVSLSEIARAYLKYKETGEMAALRNFNNQYLAEPWAEQYEERDEEEIFRLCDDRPRGTVPGPLPETPDIPRVSCLLAGIDTQKGYFRYVIRAWGFGESLESWLVQCGAVASFFDLEQLLFGSVYRDAAGHEYRVAGAMIDAMGNRTREVYAWAVHHRGFVFPWQGKRSMSSPYSMSPIEYFPGIMGNKVKIPGGLTLFQCDTTYFKSGLAQKLMIQPNDPGAFHLHSNEGGSLDGYGKEMCAEIWDDKTMAWVNPMERPNHYWDCEVMCLALADIRSVKNIPLPSQSAKLQRKPTLRTATTGARPNVGRYG